jgi:DNA replication initiation complex subunit (GINS family)
MSTLPENFYPKLRRYLNRLRENALKNPDKMQEYMKANQLARDIINNRVKKIVSLASIPTPTNQFIKNLTAEELALFEQLHQIISSWRDKILEGGKKG